MSNHFLGMSKTAEQNVKIVGKFRNVRWKTWKSQGICFKTVLRTLLIMPQSNLLMKIHMEEYAIDKEDYI